MISTFPQFTKLTLEDKDEYNRFVAEYPPFSDISFTNLHIWWDLDGKLLVANLNGNLVIHYSLPFDKDHSGYGLIGAHRVDESLRTIFSYLRDQGQPMQLVNVPEFVVEKIADKQSFLIEEEPDFNEYIMSSQQLADLEGKDHSRTRRKVSRFMRETEDRSVELRVLDLTSPEVQQTIIKAVESWSAKYPRDNDPDRIEDQVLKTTLGLSSDLETRNLCVFIDGVLQAVVLYHLTPDHQYYILNHMRADYAVPFIYDYATNQIAIKAVQENVPFLNMEMDLGSEGLKHHKMGLRPVKFFKKYKITASGGT